MKRLTLTGGQSVRPWWRRYGLGKQEERPIRALWAMRGTLSNLRRWDRRRGEYRRVGE